MTLRIRARYNHGTFADSDRGGRGERRPRRNDACTTDGRAPKILAMSESQQSHTSVTLLERLARSGAEDADAWRTFVARYGRRIYVWCLRWGLQATDAEDVTQIVLMRLAVRMKEFHYDSSRSFRAWLKTVTHHAWRDFVDHRSHELDRLGCDSANRLETVGARDDLMSSLEEQFDLERFEQAKQIVRLRVAPHNWNAFSLTKLEGVPAVEVARRLDMKIARVYSACATVQRLLTEECQRLDSEPSPN